MLCALYARIHGRTVRARIMTTKDGRKVVVIDRDGVITVRRWEAADA